jgi:hypothetical protein
VKIATPSDDVLQHQLSASIDLGRHRALRFYVEERKAKQQGDADEFLDHR